jgi:hypothetical protein
MMDMEAVAYKLQQLQRGGGMVNRVAIFVGTLLLCGPTVAQMIKVSRDAWDGLHPEERAAIQTTQVVEIYEPGSFGLVMDAQGVDRSDPGTSGGAVLGSVVAQAAYVDRAFSGNNNYSALTQLGLGILGGVVGSALDRPASQQYQFRYALRLSSGEIHYADAMSSDPFRHPPGVCLGIPSLRPVSQAICGHGPDELRRQYLTAGALPTPAKEAPTFVPAPAAAAHAGEEPVSTVLCRIGSLAPVSTTAEKCTAIGGSQQ